MAMGRETPTNFGHCCWNHPKRLTRIMRSCSKIPASMCYYLLLTGDVLSLNILRSAPAIGRVLVDWVIEAINSQPPGVRFRRYNGTLYFHEVTNSNVLFLVITNAQEYGIFHMVNKNLC